MEAQTDGAAHTEEGDRCQNHRQDGSPARAVPLVPPALGRTRFVRPSAMDAGPPLAKPGPSTWAGSGVPSGRLVVASVPRQVRARLGPDPSGQRRGGVRGAVEQGDRDGRGRAIEAPCGDQQARALLRVAGKQRRDDRAHPLAKKANRLGQVGRSVARPGPACEREPGQRSDAVGIARLGRNVSAGDLWRDEPGGPRNEGRVGLPDQARGRKVGDHRLAVAGEQHVASGQVSVDHARVVQRGERGGQCGEDGRDLAVGEPASRRDEVGQAAALGQVKHQRHAPARHVEGATQPQDVLAAHALEHRGLSGGLMQHLRRPGMPSGPAP